ncbi:MAG: phosphoenolpyruvate carboxykinase (ATP) [Thermodesulforhabdaceae bacterium]
MENAKDEEQYLTKLGFRRIAAIHLNLPPPALYEHAVRRSEGTITYGGALAVRTGKYTGRTPRDRFIVREPSSEADIWWGEINQPFEEEKFNRLFRSVIAYLEGKELFVQDCAVGADPQYRLRLRVVTEKAWQSLFAYNMFLRIQNEENEIDSELGSDPFLIISVPDFEACPELDGTVSEAFIIIHLAKRIILIGGTGYGGEIKKAVFTVMNYFMPKHKVFPMHCAANVGKDGKVALFFGLSGTGKTSLSSDPDRFLIGDDEHGWSHYGVFNFEGGCYAKVIRLSEEAEPLIYRCTKSFGTILENVIYDKKSRVVDLDDDSITENTRASYPLVSIEQIWSSGVADHPLDLIMLTCDAFGVLPPIALLTPEQAIYYFLSGYTAKVAGTEAGIVEPVATFSTCFGAPFMILSPIRYAEQLGNRINRYKPRCWLVNTGWIKGPYGIGERIPIGLTRRMVKAALNGELSSVNFHPEPYFGLFVPERCPDIPEEILHPDRMWKNRDAYASSAEALKKRFRANFEKFAPYVPEAVKKVT